VLLSQLTSSVPRLALVGLAKNTGKTVALAALLGELRSAGRIVGVTSVGRDGEAHDVIDTRIEKPAVRLWSGCLVATTDGLLRGSGIPHELLEQTDVRTPLGRVLIARLRGHGAIEVAGPSIAAEVRAVSDAMLTHGAEQVLIDGAIDRRAASSPAVADALLISTGAILSEDIDQVVARTAEAVQLVRLPALSADAASAAKIRALAQRRDPGAGLLIAEDPDRFSELPARFVLTAEPPVIEGLLREGVAPRWLLVGGALPEAFLNGLVPFVRRNGGPLTVLVSDPTHVFISQRDVDFYSRAGISIETLAQIDLRAMTVNPVAPRSHSFDSARLRGLLARAVPGLEIFDVMDPSYATAAAELPAGDQRPPPG
jgi:hypothetical protein